MTHQPVVIITGAGSGLGAAMALRLKRCWPSRYGRQASRMASRAGSQFA